MLNKTIFDIENQSANVEDFNIKDLELNKPIKLIDGLGEHPTRLMLRVSDVGVSQVGSQRLILCRSELAVYQNKSYIRNNLLFSQSLHINTVKHKYYNFWTCT